MAGYADQVCGALLRSPYSLRMANWSHEDSYSSRGHIRRRVDIVTSTSGVRALCVSAVMKLIAQPFVGLSCFRVRHKRGHRTRR